MWKIMWKIIFFKFLSLLCYIVPIGILLLVFRGSLFKSNTNSFSFVFAVIVGLGAVGLITGLGLHKVKSLYVLLAGALLAWLLNTDIDTRVFYLAPLFIGAGMFVDEILISPIYKKLVVTLKGGRK